MNLEEQINPEENRLQVIQKQQNSVLENIKDIQITNDEENESASILLRNIKSASSKIKEYWKPLKDSASKAHKDLVAREKQMLTPLEEAEIKIKAKISSYIMELDKKAKEQAELIRKAQEEEALKQLEQAEKLKSEGNEIEAQIVEEMAYAIDENKTELNSAIQKQDGISYMTDYKIIVTDSTKVPNYINETEIRPIDIGILKRIVKNANGNIKIDGIKIIEDKIIKVRS